MSNPPASAKKKGRVVRLLRIVMPIVALICIAIFPPWNGILAWLAPLPATVQAQVDSAVARGLDGIIVYVDQVGHEPALYAAGWKNRAEQIPADPQALFKIASISKLYIAAAAAKLITDERLSLDATLADFLPELAGKIEYADRITLKMLLQHRSGIPNFTDQAGFAWHEPPPVLSDNLALVLDRAADFEPGTRYAYCNTNYLLIGDILDKTLGYSHHEYIEKEIVAPLGLTHTYSLLSQVDIADVVSGYHHPHEADFREADYVIPGGSMVATAQDVGIFLRALNDGSLLSEEEQAVYASIYEYEHKGWVLGYQSTAGYNKDIDAIVIQFVNTTGKNSELTTTVVFNRIVRILRGE